MSRLRVVAPGDNHTEITMTEAIEQLCAKLIAAQPVALLVAFEQQATKDGPGKLQYATIPQSFALAVGFAGELFNKFAAERVPADEDD